MTRKNATFRLKESVIEKIKTLAEEERLSQAGVIDFLVDSHFEDRSVEHLLLRDTLAELMDEKLAGMEEDLKRVRLTANVIDRNTQMQNEFWNHSFIIGEQTVKFASTKEHKTRELREAEAVVLERIAEGRKRNLEKRRP